MKFPANRTFTQRGQPAQTRGWKLLYPLTVLLLVSLACSMPTFGRTPTDTSPTTTPGISIAQPTSSLPTETLEPAPQVQLPPALVESEPLPGSDITPDSAPVLYFNQAMERASVETALHVEPDLPVRLEWIDDATVRVQPEQPLEAGTALQLTIDPAARAANGQSLAEPVQLSYQAPDLLRVAERIPQPESQQIDPSSTVVVTFTQPVVGLGADPADSPAGFTITAQDGSTPAGRGEWVNTSTYVFYPQPALSGGSTYTVQINAALASTAGTPLAEEDAAATWRFTTVAPALVTIQPGTEQPVELDAAFTLTFNQPMDAASIEAAFQLTRADGTPAPGTFTWNAAGTAVTFQPQDLLDRGSEYNLFVSGQAKSQGGAALGTDVAASIVTVPQFGVSSTNPAIGEGLEVFFGYASVNINFSAPVAPGQDYRSLVRISPEVSGLTVRRSYEGYDLTVEGYFAPGSSYTLEILPALQDRWGAALGTPFVFTFSTLPAAPALSLPLMIFVPEGEAYLPVRSMNIERVALSRGTLTVAEMIAAQESWEGWQDWQANVQEEWEQVYTPTPNTVETLSLPLQPSAVAPEPGLYFLNAVTSPASDETRPPSVMVVSPIHMTLKTSLHQAFVWAVRLADQSPAAGLAVTFYDSNAQPVATCTTDANGACQADIPPVDSFDAAYYAVVGQPGDSNFSLAADSWMEGVSPWMFGLGYARGTLAPKVYLYTDRPIYRPDQTVYFRAIVRAQDDGHYSPPPGQSITVEVISPYDPVTYQTQTLATMKLPLDAYGSASAVYQLPADARPGTYILRVQEAQFQDLYFTVAEYRKPEVDVLVAFSNTDQLFGEDLQASVTARYFFGAPASNVAVRWTLYGMTAAPVLPDQLSAGRVDTSWMSYDLQYQIPELYVTEGQGMTAPDGSFTLSIPGDLLRERLETWNGQTLQLRLEATVEDETGLPVSARARMILHPSQYYAGVRAEQWMVSAGEEITYSVRTVDWQGQPVGDLPLRASFRKVTWVQEEADSLYALPSFRMESSDVGSVDFRSSAGGDARLAFTPPEPGTYLLEITGDGGILSQVLSWVGGAGSAVWPVSPNQRLQLQTERQTYQPGEEARILIPNPFSGGALALVTVERDRVLRSEVISITAASHELMVPLGGDDVPNVFVSVTLLGRTNGRPDFRVGYQELAVTPVEQVLQVTAEASGQKVQPGQEATITLRVRDSAGEPVQGQFSLALVDKAVLALADPNSEPILEAFYHPQWLGVKSSYAMAVYAGRLLATPPGRGGGGGGADMTAPLLRENFADTAYWNGAIETDANGEAQVRLTLPDNLTTWVADVRGLTQDTRVGQTTLEMTASKPLLIRPVVPRFAVLGDHIELKAVVQNNSSDPLQVSVRLEGAGFTFDDLNTAVQPVDIAAGQRAEVRWWGTVQDVAALDLTFQADAGTLQDASRPEMGLIPVLRYVAPETFATSGMLTEAGQELELVSLPRSFTPIGGDLRVELSPSLTAAVLTGLQALEEFPHDFTEPVVSRLLPNLITLRALQEVQLEDATLRAELESAIVNGVDRLVRLQNEDGGWGWSFAKTSDAYLSSYVVLALTYASQGGVFVDAEVLRRGQEYLVATLESPDVSMEPYMANRQAFQEYVLQVSGRNDLALEPLFDLRDKLSPWGQAFLALALEQKNPGDERARTLLADLEGSASRSASGANWQDPNPYWNNWSSPLSTTAIVAYALARLDPASPLLADAVRYLVLNRRPNGGWSSSYETAWSLLALVETVRGTGDLQADYTFAAALNGTPLVSGQASSPAEALNPVVSITSLESLYPDTPNALEIQRGEGSGRLYYRAYLNASRPVESAPAIERGLTITRQYYRSDQDCREEICQPIIEASVADPQPLIVRLTVTLSEDMYYLVIEDHFPSGVEVLNPRLNTTQQAVPVQEPPVDTEGPTGRPFEQAWGWWYFAEPQQYDDQIRWVADYLPAGTYELTYRITPFLAGEFRLLPARAYQYYFPEVEGRSAGAVLSIR